jgi:hypothetical protein
MSRNGNSASNSSHANRGGPGLVCWRWIVRSIVRGRPLFRALGGGWPPPGPDERAPKHPFATF